MAPSLAHEWAQGRPPKPLPWWRLGLSGERLLQAVLGAVRRHLGELSLQVLGGERVATVGAIDEMDVVARVGADQARDERGARGMHAEGEAARTLLGRQAALQAVDLGDVQ